MTTERLLITLRCIFRIARGAMAGIGLSVVAVIAMVNLPGSDPSASGGYFMAWLVMAPCFAVIWAMADILSAPYPTGKTKP